MSFIQGVYVNNPHAVLYLKGNTNSNDSQRIVVDEKTKLLVVEKRIEGKWTMADFRHIQTFDEIVTTKDGVVINKSGNIITTN